MCTTCGCSGDGKVIVTDMPLRHVGESGAVGPRPHTHSHHDHDHHDQAHQHAHHHHDSDGPVSRGSKQVNAGPDKAMLTLERRVLEKNDRLAAWNRGWFAGRKVLALNLVSSPGAGKTTLLERTIAELGEDVSIAVIEGDQATVQDADRIRRAGAPVVQINTGAGCHLDAEMVAKGVEQLDPPIGALVLIENVGNLVCPAMFDLGEHAKVVIASVTEGEDKPIKYPHMFRAAELVIVNKIDLLPHVPFQVERFLELLAEVNPRAAVIQVSALNGEGMEPWRRWVQQQMGR